MTEKAGKRCQSDPLSHKGATSAEVIKDYMKAYSFDLPTLAKKLRVNNNYMEEILSGKVLVNDIIAIRLSEIFNRPVLFWMGLDDLVYKK